MSAEKLYYVVYDTGGDDKLVLGPEKATYDIEHCRKDHAYGYRVGDIGQEEYRLQYLLESLYRVESDRYEQRDNCRKRDRPHAKQHGIFKALKEALILYDLDEVADRI